MVDNTEIGFVDGLDAVPYTALVRGIVRAWIVFVESLVSTSNFEESQEVIACDCIFATAQQ